MLFGNSDNVKRSSSPEVNIYDRLVMNIKMISRTYWETSVGFIQNQEYSHIC